MKKVIKSENYNLVFDTETGFMARWGKTKEDDPEMCPWGPEIADVEISTVCNGIGKDVASRKPCPWCYKSNTGVGKNMNLDKFKSVFQKLNFTRTLTQIAFGIGDIDANPDLWNIMRHCRENGVIPNVTVNGMGITPGDAKMLSELCGAVAVSHYGPAHQDNCFETIAYLTKVAGMKQVNIHKLLSKETLKDCYDLIDKASKKSKTDVYDQRLDGLKAIVFLLLKPKGDRNRMNPVDIFEYERLMAYAQDRGVAIGMDSCSAPLVLKTMPAEVIPSVEPCESTLFSIYVNVDGEVFPCSFTEGTMGWECGIPLDGPSKGDADGVWWYHPRLVEWRRGLLDSSRGCTQCAVQQHCRSCPVYDISPCNPKPNLQVNDAVVQLKLRSR